MNIDLSKDELELLDDALKEWAAAPSRDGIIGSIMAAILEPRSGEGARGAEQIKAEKESEIQKFKWDSAARERKTLSLRAKLAKAFDTLTVADAISKDPGVRRE